MHALLAALHPDELAAAAAFAGGIVIAVLALGAMLIEPFHRIQPKQIS